MNAAKLYAIVRALEAIGLPHDMAFERAFYLYKEIKKELRK